jgi:restriction system protein
MKIGLGWRSSTSKQSAGSTRSVALKFRVSSVQLRGRKLGRESSSQPATFNAREYAASLHQKLVLIDGRRLAELMIEHNIGVAPEQPYIIKKIDTDYFEEA